MKASEFIEYIKSDSFFIEEDAIRALLEGFEGTGVYSIATEYHDYSFELTDYETVAEARQTIDDEEGGEYYWSDFNSEDTPKDVLWGEGWGFVFLEEDE